MKDAAQPSMAGDLELIGEIVGTARDADLIGNHRDLLTAPQASAHEANEVRFGSSEEPLNARHQRLRTAVQDQTFAAGFALTITVHRRQRVLLGERPFGVSREDVISRDIDTRNPSSCRTTSESSGGVAIELICGLRVTLAAVDVGESGAVDDQRRLELIDSTSDGVVVT